MFGKDNKKKELVNNLGEIYARIEREHQISPGDFPNLRKMQVSSGILARAANIQGKRLGDCREYSRCHTGTDCCCLWKRPAAVGLEILAGCIWA